MINWWQMRRGNLHGEEEGLLSRAARNLSRQPNHSQYTVILGILAPVGFHLDRSKGNSMSFKTAESFLWISHSTILLKSIVWDNKMNVVMAEVGIIITFSTQVQHNYTQLCPTGWEWACKQNNTDSWREIENRWERYDCFYKHDNEVPIGHGTRALSSTFVPPQL